MGKDLTVCFQMSEGFCYESLKEACRFPSKGLAKEKFQYETPHKKEADEFIEKYEENKKIAEQKRLQKMVKSIEDKLHSDMKWNQELLDAEFDEMKRNANVVDVEGDKIGIPKQIWGKAMQEERELIVWRISNENDVSEYILAMNVNEAEGDSIELPSWARLNLKGVHQNENGVRLSLMKNPRLEKVAKVVFKIDGEQESILLEKYGENIMQAVLDMIDENMKKYDAFVVGQYLELKTEEETFVIQVGRIENEGGIMMQRCMTRVRSGKKDIVIDLEFASQNAKNKRL